MFKLRWYEFGYGKKCFFENHLNVFNWDLVSLHLKYTRFGLLYGLSIIVLGLPWCAFTLLMFGIQFLV